MLHRFLKHTLFSSIIILSACKVKNPIAKDRNPDDSKLQENGAVTANVISVHDFVQRPYDNQILRQGLSGYSSITFVASDTSSYESVANPEMGCRAAGSFDPGISLSRYLSIGEVTITSSTGTSSTFQSREIGYNPYAFSEAIALPSGIQTLQSSGLNAGILRFQSEFKVAPHDPDIQIQIDGNPVRQPMDFPSYDTLGVVELDRNKDALIHLNSTGGADYIRVYLGDNDQIFQECYFAPQTTLRLPASALSQVGSPSSTSDLGLIHIDFVTRVLAQNPGLHLKQLYIESTVRHTQGFEDFGSVQLQTGILRLL